MIYNPNLDKYLTVAQVMTRQGTKNIKLILDLDANTFYTLDDDNNFLALEYQPPTLSFYITGNTSATTIASSSTWFNFSSNVAPVLQYQSQLNNGLHLNTNTGKIEYSGDTRYFMIIGHVEVSSGNNKEIEIAAFKNDILIPGSISMVITGSGGKTSTIPGMAITSLSNGDVVDIKVNNNTDTTDITVSSLNVIIKGI